jgi:hypothetical protein
LAALDWAAPPREPPPSEDRAADAPEGVSERETLERSTLTLERGEFTDTRGLPLSLLEEE